jgi:hypothetical protein
MPFATKQQLVTTVLTWALEAGVSFRRFTADETFRAADNPRALKKP